MPPMEGKDQRPRRPRRDAEGAAGAGARGQSGGLSLKYLAVGILAVVAICGCQFMLLTRHVESPGGHEAQFGQGAVNDAVWRYLGRHEANLTALAFQQRDMVQLLRQLGEDLRRQHEELSGVEQRLGGGAGASGGFASGARQAPDLQSQRLQALQGAVAQLRQRIGSSPEGAPPLHHSAAASGLASGVGGGSGAGAPQGGVPRVKGDYPAEWLKRFSKEELAASAAEAERWREGAKKTFMHAWNGYKKQAWGKDEFKPVSGQTGRTWANCGLQILDALSTMYIMELHEPFDEATKWVEESLNFDYTGLVSFFEITIRALGGLVSAHSLSGREVYLRRAKELADKMLPAFDDSMHGFPWTQVNLRTGKGSKGWFSGTVLSEAGTVQLEFRYISQHTGDPKYANAADKAMRSIIAASGGRGLVPWGLSGKPSPHTINQHITFGAMGDSYYEYLLKMYLQTAKTEPEWKDVWKKAMREMMERLVLKTRGGLTYVAEENNGKRKLKMDHLACFVGGMLVYGARTLPEAEVDPQWEPAGAGITETCYQMYHRQPSHLAPEAVEFNPDGTGNNDMHVWQSAAHYLLRPEAAEAIFYMFYYTGDPKYRRMAGEIYEAIEAHTKTTYGYSAVRDVRSPNPQMRNEMETFFLAETMKYLYLTFHPNPREVMDLDEFVLTTEAHPLRIFRGGSAGGAGAGAAFLGRAPS